MNSHAAADKHLKDPRYVRWQGIAMAQFTVAIALLSALSIAALGASLTLLTHSEFSTPGAHGLALGLSMLMLVAVIFFCLLATVSRTLDFRLTARTVRGRTDLMLFCLNKDQFGRLTWRLFWTALLLFLAGGLLFVASACLLFAPKLLGGA